MRELASDFAQSFLHRQQLKPLGPKRGPRPSLIDRSLISSPLGRLTAWPNQPSLLWINCADILVKRRQNRCASCVECGGCCHCQRPPASFLWPLALATFRDRRAKLSSLLPGRPCTLYAAVLHAATKDTIDNVRMQNGLQPVGPTMLPHIVHASVIGDRSRSILPQSEFLHIPHWDLITVAVPAV